ncbi:MULTISPECIES: hypothetical protein [unclassified Variovorax]|jgi:hypothetical protein|uniref:hypothetical protein n=1 Tax=unclassified Variovorax TaxID=663243 RepID=UPI001BD5346E|nr:MULTISPECIES: hypothetical protein [unclassified Variovorax]
MKHLRSFWPEIAVAAFVLIVAASSVMVPPPERDVSPAAGMRSAPSYPEAPLRAGALLP